MNLFNAFKKWYANKYPKSGALFVVTYWCSAHECTESWAFRDEHNLTDFSATFLKPQINLNIGEMLLFVRELKNSKQFIYQDRLVWLFNEEIKGHLEARTSA